MGFLKVDPQYTSHLAALPNSCEPAPRGTLRGTLEASLSRLLTARSCQNFPYAFKGAPSAPGAAGP